MTEKRGIFITFEGGDGVGKSTHIRFLANALMDQGFEVLCLREPGGTAIGENLRSIVLDPANEAMSPEAELLIYEAARAQIVAEVIRPALDRGAVVLCDRFFDSTVAYQAFGRGLDRAFVEAANLFATGGLVPDRTILLTLGEASQGAGAGLDRAAGRADADRLELAGRDFHTRVATGFLALAEEYPERVRPVDSSGDRSLTSAMIFHELSDLFPWMRNAALCSEEFFAVLDSPFGAPQTAGSAKQPPCSTGQGGARG